MPISKNRRKSKRGHSRKENKAKAANNQGSGGFEDVGTPPVFENPAQFAPQPRIPGLRTVEMGINGGRRYKVTSPPDDPQLSEMEQIDAIIERSVTFEMTEAHHHNIGLRDSDLDGEFEGGDILGPLVAKVEVDPLSTIKGHSEWKTGQEMIDYLDSDPHVFRGKFDGNRWQGLGVLWMECPPSMRECLDGVGTNDRGNPAQCPQCDTEINSEETHFHILDEDGLRSLCGSCWSKGQDTAGPSPWAVLPTGRAG